MLDTKLNFGIFPCFRMGFCGEWSSNSWIWDKCKLDKRVGSLGVIINWDSNEVIFKSNLD